MASPDVIKSVSRKLKYYLEIQRLEDGFDLSGPDCPRMDHPPIRARSALQYSGLHDRPLKHYFHRPSVRVALTNFKTTDDKNSEQEDEIRRSIMKNMRKYQFNSQSLADDYYGHDSRAGRRLQPEIGWRGTQLVPGKMPYMSGRRTLRSAPPDTISRKETKRLLDSTCHLVLAAESGLRSETDSSEDEDEKKDATDKTKQNKCNKVNQKKGKDTESPPPGERALNNDNAGQKKESTTMLVKRNHEKKDMQQQHKQHSSSDSDKVDQRQPRKSSPESRNKQNNGAAAHNASAGQHHKTIESHSKQPQKTATKEQHKTTSSSDEKFLGRVSIQPVRTKSAKYKRSPTRDNNVETRSSLRNPRNKRLTRSYDQFCRTLEIGTQTSGELLKDYDPSEQVLTEGAEVKYHVNVQTGKCAGAGTKAEILIVLIGDVGRTEYLPLSEALTPHKIKFKRNQHDLFEVFCPSIGNLQQIKIGHSKQQAEYKWYVESVTVRDFARRVEYRIPCQKWLSGAFGDRETFGEFKVKSSSTFSADDVDTMDFDPEGTYVAMVRTERRVSLESENPNLVSEDRAKNCGSLSVENSQTTEMKNGEGGTNDDDSNHQSDSSSVISEGELKITVSPTTPKSPEKSEPPRPDRNDNFFDQRVRENDYSSIIESIISHLSDSENTSVVPHFASSGARLSQIEDGNRERTYESYSERSTAYLEPRSAPVHQKGTHAKVCQSPTLNQSMQDAVRSSRYNDFLRLAEDHPELLEQMIDGEYAPIHLAASYNQLEILKWLTSHVTDVDLESKRGHTALQLAAINGYMDCLKVLFEMGAKINYRNSSGLTALHLATMVGNVNSVKWLLENGASKTVRNNNGSTPLDVAKELSHNEIVKVISSFATTGKRGASKKVTRKVDKNLML